MKRCLLLLVVAVWPLLIVLPQARAAMDEGYPTLTLWPLAYHRAGADSSTTDVLWPIIHHERRQTHTLFKIRPFLFASEADPARDFRRVDVLWPLSRFESDGAERWNHLFPILWSGKNARRHWFHLWPLYGAEEKADGTRSHFTLYPLFGYSSNAQNDDWSADYLWPLGHAYRSDTTSGARLLPLWWQRQGPDASSGLIFPYFWHTAPQETTRGLFPLWYWSSGPDSRFSLLLPLYLERKTADSYLFAVVPGFFRYHDSDTTATGLLPLWYRQTGPAARFTLLFPLYLDKSAADSQLRVLFPGFFSARSSAGTTTGLVPLWLQRVRGESRFSLLLPVYLNQSDPQGSTTLLLPFWLSSSGADWQVRTLFPVYWQLHTPESDLRLIPPLHLLSRDARDETEVWPLYFRHRDRAAGSELRYYFPFYGRYTLRDSETRHYLFFPLYAHFVDRERDWQSWNVLWPLLHLETAPASYETWLLPFFWMSRAPQEASTMALGLYWSRQRADAGWSLLLPLWWSSHTAEGETRLLLPLYAERQRADGWRKRFFLGPLAIASQDPAEERKQLDILWPVFSRSSSPQQEHARLIPFFWHTATPERELTLASLALLPPYYLHRKTPQEERYHLWPLFGSLRAGDYQEYSSLWPLVRWGGNADGSRRTRQFFLYYDYVRNNRHVGGLFPLLHHWSDATASDTVSLLHWYGTDNRGYHLSLLHLGQPDLSLVNVKREGTSRHQHVFPIYGLSSDSASDSLNLSLLGPLYLYARQGEQSRSHHFLWKVVYAERAPDRSEAGVLWRLVRSRSSGERQLFEFNPFYYRERRAGEEFVSWLGGLYATRTDVAGEETRLFWLLRWGKPAPAAGESAGAAP